MTILRDASQGRHNLKFFQVEVKMSLEQSSTKSAIGNFPNEILEEIFSYLEFEERLTASQVCLRWHGTALRWSDIRLGVYSPDESDLKTILASERPYRHLQLNGDQFAAQLVTKFGTSLRSLSITNVETWSWLGSLAGLPELQSIFIKTSYRYDSLTDAPLREPCPTLRWLTIEEIGSDVFPALNRFISATFPALECLRVEYYTGVFRLSNLPELAELVMIGYNEIDDGLLADIKSLKNLRTIDLAGRRLECDYPDHVLCSDHIRTVQIGTDDPLFDEQLLQLTAVFPAMTSFSCTRWSLCTVAGIDAARRRLPNCVFEVEPTEDSMEVGAGSDGEDSSSETESS